MCSAPLAALPAAKMVYPVIGDRTPERVAVHLQAPDIDECPKQK
jgi:hypothetical protein